MIINTIILDNYLIINDIINLIYQEQFGVFQWQRNQ
jgi:hypothetical protein